jgi:membrane fusion protein, copper/silver efflux system
MRGMALAGVLLLSVISVVAARGDVAAVIGNYLAVQRVLSADRVDSVRDAAARIAAAATDLGAEGESIRSAADLLEQAGDVASARAAFGKLGDAIMIFAKDAGVTLPDDVRVAYCPMVRKYWLQKGEEIQNPFYGSKMLDCGRIVAKIPELKR